MHDDSQPRTDQPAKVVVGIALCFIGLTLVVGNVITFGAPNVSLSFLDAMGFLNSILLAVGGALLVRENWREER